MAGRPEDDVLELDTELEPEDQTEAEQTDGDAEEGDDEGEDAPVFGFDGEEAAPASESDSSVIRELRKANRELQKRIAAQERKAEPQPVEIGEKPSMESCEYDEDRFETELDAWKARKAKRAEQDRTAGERQQSQAREWSGRMEAYEADKRSIRVADYQAAEEEVFAALPVETQAVLLTTKKPAALIYALAKNPAKLAELSELNLMEAAKKIGVLEDRLQMGTRRPPNPDRPVRGNAAPVNADKELARLEKEASRTNDRSAVAAYKANLKNRAR